MNQLMNKIKALAMRNALHIHNNERVHEQLPP